MTDEATEESRRIWDDVAPGWERYREVVNELERRVTERMLEAVDARNGDTILELTAGSGGVGIPFAASRPDVRVLITDFSPRMVAAAERAARERGLGNVETRVLDAQAIDLPDASVDGVISRYGLMIVPDPKRAFLEIRRVLKPGRALAYTVWGPLETNPWMMLFGATLMMRGHFTPPEDGGFFPLTSEEENRAVASAAGFDRVEVDVMDLPLPYDSFERYWELSSALSGPLAGIVKGLPADEQAAVREALQEYAAPFRSGAGLQFPSRRIFVRAS